MRVRFYRTNHFSQSGYLKIYLQTLRVSDIFPSPEKFGVNPVLKLLFPEKSAPSFISRTYDRALKASLTVEAAMVLPLFIFFAVTLMQPMIWLDDQRKLQTVTEVFGEELSQLAYLDGSESGADESSSLTFTDVTAGAALKLLTMEFMDNAVIKTSKLSDENGDIRLEVSFYRRPPFAGFFSPAVVMNAGTVRRPWTGLDGKLKSAGSSGQEQDSEETMVFIGKTMTRYHLFRDCHYLSNDYSTMSESEAQQTKNSAGSYYKPCAKCASTGQASAIVYVTPSGGHYHRDPDCPSMRSYVSVVPLSEVEYLGCCSYCARKKDG